MKPYIVTCWMGLREQSYFGLSDQIRKYLLRAAGLGMMLLIWHSLFAQGIDREGLSLDQMLSYTLMSFALRPMLDVRSPAPGWLHDGTFIDLYKRPTSLLGQLISHTVGGWLTQLLFFAVPTLLLGGLLGIRVLPATLWFFPSLFLSVILGFAIDFLFTCMQLKVRNLEWTMYAIRGALNTLLTGALIPFAALPWGLGRWFALTPLGMLAGAPLSLFVGLARPMALLPAQLIWTLLLWPFSLWLFAHSQERMVSFGG